MLLIWDAVLLRYIAHLKPCSIAIDRRKLDSRLIGNDKIGLLQVDLR